MNYAGDVKLLRHLPVTDPELKLGVSPAGPMTAQATEQEVTVREVTA
jgi:hypothetical protein